MKEYLWQPYEQGSYLFDCMKKGIGNKVIVCKEN